MSVTECAIHISREGLPLGEMLDRVDYMGFRDIAGAHPGLIKVISNVPQATVVEVVYGNELTENC